MDLNLIKNVIEMRAFSTSSIRYPKQKDIASFVSKKRRLAQKGV